MNKVLEQSIKANLNKELAEEVIKLLNNYQSLLAKIDADMTHVNAVLAKLDADAGVTDTDYASGNTVDVNYESTLKLKLD